MIRRTIVSTGLVLLFACGGDSAFVPDTGGFDVDPADQEEMDTAAEQGEGADGSYDWDDGSDTLTLTIEASTFECGIVVGTIVATVTELTSTRMVWTVEDSTVVWTRVDHGDTGVVGIWETDDPHLYLILGADGSAQIFGEPEICDRPQNSDSCYQIWPTGATIVIDGDLSDWDAIGQEGTLEDALGDYLGDDPGADLAAMKVEYAPGTVSVLQELAGPPSTAFQGGGGPDVGGGAYRLYVKGKNGLSLYERVIYDPNTAAFVTVGDSSGAVTAAAGADGIEWQVDVSSYVGEGFTEVELVMVETLDLGAGGETLDQLSCGFFEVP